METSGSLLGPVPVSPGPHSDCGHGARVTVRPGLPSCCALLLGGGCPGCWGRGAGPEGLCLSCPPWPAVARRGLPWPAVASQPQGPQLPGRRSPSWQGWHRWALGMALPPRDGGPHYPFLWEAVWT